MKASRPSRVITNASPPEPVGLLGVLRRQANNILTFLLVIAAVAMLVRWRIRTAEAAKISINTELQSAETQVKQVPGIQFSNLTPPEMIKKLNYLQNGANAAISNVLNSSDADAQTRARAFIARGDLYWYLANLPPLPGGTTQPSLALNENSPALLQKAWDAYQEVLKNSTYADDHQSLSIAHLGVAAIAENRGDWSAAKQEFQAVVNDPKALKVLATNAQFQLLMMPILQDKYYIAPPDGTPVTAAPISPMPATTQASTQAATLPTTIPTAMPAKLLH